MCFCNECEKILDGSNFYKKVKNRRKDCLNKKLKCQACGKFFTKKCLTTHIEREQGNGSNSIMLEKPKTFNVNTNNNNRTLLVGPSFSGKTYLMLKNFFTKTRSRFLYNH